MKIWGWVTNKPLFDNECLVITANRIRENWDYSTYIIQKVQSDDGWYMGWLTGEGEEYGDLNDLRADKYLVLPLLKK
jgi:hypothetical protein